MALTVKLDKAGYAPGDPMLLTVTTTEADRARFIDTPVVVHIEVEGVGEADTTAVLKRPTTAAAITVSDPDRTWAPVSDNGTTTATFSAKA